MKQKVSVGVIYILLEMALSLGVIFVESCSSKGIESGANAHSSRKGEGKMEKATFAAGCFWGVEAAFREIDGVTSTTAGYTGGHLKNPTYKDVCSGTTGHAEAVQVLYNPSVVSYEKLLDVFWQIHDPTTKNRQGPDVGEQYRSAIFFHTPEQETFSRASRDKLAKSGKYKSPIVTEITPASEFYKAEEYHQRYLGKRGLKICH
jgi:peptide-methionine (S)-S-oxide reductase